MSSRVNGSARASKNGPWCVHRIRRGEPAQIKPGRIAEPNGELVGVFQTEREALEVCAKANKQDEAETIDIDYRHNRRAKLRGEGLRR